MEDRSAGAARNIGAVALAIGLVGAALGAVLVWLGLFWVEGASATMVEGLVLADESLEAIAETIDVAEVTIEITGRSLDEIEASLEVVSDSFSRVDTVLAETAVIVSEDISDSVQGLLDAMPGLIEVGDTLDVTLANLSFFGVDYDPDQPIGEGFRAMQRALFGLPEQLRAQGGLLLDVQGDLEETREGIEVVRTGLIEIRQELDATAGLLGRYRATTDEGEELIARMQRDVDEGAPLLRIGLVVGGLFLVMSQVLPMYLGWRLLRHPGDPFGV